MVRVELRIVYDQQQFYAGQVLSGHVLVKLDAPVPVTLLKLRTLGEGLVRWTISNQSTQYNASTHQTTTDNSSRTVSRQEKYLDVKITLFQSESGQDIGSGEHRYQFTTQLPPNLPGSFDVGKKVAAIGYIRYVCRATLKSTAHISLLSSKCKVTEPFILNGMAPTPLGQVAILSQEDSRKIPCCGCCCVCFTCGKIKATISVNKSHFLVGDTVIIKAEAENHSRITLDSIKVAIMQRIDLYASGGNLFYDGVTDGALDLDKGPLRPGEKLSLSEIRLTVPQLPSTIEGSSQILFVRYFAAVILSKGTGICAPKVGFRVPITIGPTSMAQVLPQSGHAEYSPSYMESVITSQPVALNESSYFEYG